MGKANPSKECLHIVLRIQRHVQYQGQKSDVVELHNAVAAKHGAVAVAKFGQPLSGARVDIIRDEIRGERGNRLILLFKERGEFVAVSARLQDIPTGSIDNSLIPSYYNALGSFANSAVNMSRATWFTVREKFTPATISDLYLATSKRPLLDVVGECRTSALFVSQS